MDPDETLDEQRDVCEHLRGQLENEDHGFTEEDVEQATRLVDISKGLDEWVMKGGSLPDEWALRCNGGLLTRAQLAQRVYDEALEHTETFEGDFGMQLAYLFGAILNGRHITLHFGVCTEREVLEFFQIIWPKDHPVWEHVKIDSAITAAS